MAKFYFEVEETVINTYVIEADTIEIAKEKYHENDHTFDIVGETHYQESELLGTRTEAEFY